MSERLRLNQDLKFRDLQEYVKKANERDGSVARDPIDTILLLVEQLGRLAKAVRKDKGIAMHAGSEMPAVENELAGLLYYVVSTANYFGLDLEKAFRNRERRFRRKKNRNR